MQKQTEKVTGLMESNDHSYFPECWSDDRRMGILLAEFRPRQLNSVSYDSKLKFWKDLILSSCVVTGTSVVSINTLKERFRRKGTVPYCLNTVFQDMLTNGEICDEVQYKDQQRTGTYGINLWTAGQLVKAPLVWGYKTVCASVTGSASIAEHDKFIVKTIAEKHAKTIENMIEKQELHNKVMKYEDFLNLLPECSNITHSGAEPAIILLEKDKIMTRNVITIDGKQTTLIKFAQSNAAAQPLTDIEISIYELEQSERRIMNDITSIEHNISQTMDEVRDRIKHGQKQMAKTLLKKKHTLEKNMQCKINALETLQGILLKIHNCQSEKNVIEAYKLGTNALKNALNASGITIDQLNDTMAEMKQVFEQHNDMLSLIGSISEDDVDELELEQELGDLIDMKLAENNIDQNNFQMPPLPPATENKHSNAHDFDSEIEKRLAALRVNVSESFKVPQQSQ